MLLSFARAGQAIQQSFQRLSVRTISTLLICSLVFTPIFLNSTRAEAGVNDNCSSPSIAFWANKALTEASRFWLWGEAICTNMTQKRVRGGRTYPCWYSCGRVASAILKKAGCEIPMITDEGEFTSGAINVTSSAYQVWQQMEQLSELDEGERQFEYTDYPRAGCLIGFNSVDIGEPGKRLERLGPNRMGESSVVAYRHIGVMIDRTAFVENAVDGGVKLQPNYLDFASQRPDYHAPIFLCPKR